MNLVQKDIKPFGPMWMPRGGERQLERIGAEVDEYFRDGIELSPGDVVVDVGANVGAFAMLAARKTAGLTFLCVEPIPILFSALAKNFESDPALRHARKQLFRLGLTHTNDESETEFTYFSALPCDSTRHIDDKREQFEKFFHAKGGGALAWLIGSRVGRWVSDLVTGATRVRCELATLERVLDEAHVDDVALLKIDVEGAELDVLRGITSWPRIRQIVLEGHNKNGRRSEITHLLASHGYDITHDRPELAEDRGLDNFLLYARRQSLGKSSGRGGAGSFPSGVGSGKTHDGDAGIVIAGGTGELAAK